MHTTPSPTTLFDVGRRPRSINRSFFRSFSPPSPFSVTFLCLLSFTSHNIHYMTPITRHSHANLLPITEQKTNTAQPNTDKWLSSPSHFSTFFTVSLLFKCCFVAWKGGLPQHLQVAFCPNNSVLWTFYVFGDCWLLSCFWLYFKWLYVKSIWKISFRWIFR